MAEKVQLHDFITLQYTGKLPDGTVFDTTDETIAKQHGLFAKNASYGPMTICVGEKQILPGLDDALVDKEVGNTYTILLSPEQAFGKRDIKNLRIVPMNVFREHKLNPQPGLQITVDGQLGIVNQVSGGRVIVNFNHPLAGRDVQYDVELLEKVTDVKMQLETFLHTALRIPKKELAIQLDEKRATIALPVALPKEFTDILGKKLATLTALEEVTITSKAREEKTEKSS